MYFLFQLDIRLNQIAGFKKLAGEPQSFWVELLNKYFVNKNMVTVSRAWDEVIQTKYANLVDSQYFLLEY